jgi:hypothetical protein
MISGSATRAEEFDGRLIGPLFNRVPGEHGHVGKGKGDGRVAGAKRDSDPEQGLGRVGGRVGLFGVNLTVVSGFQGRGRDTIGLSDPFSRPWTPGVIDR